MPTPTTPPWPVRVVVADDRPTSRAGLTRALEQAEGIEVVSTVGSAVQVLRESVARAVHVAVVEFSLPGMAAPELCTALRERLPGVRMIVVSAQQNEATVLQAFAAGANGYLVQSSAPIWLALAVRSVADGGRFVDPRVADRVVDLAVRGKRASGPYGLTLTELRVLDFLPRGYSNAQIAAELGVAEVTVKTHVRGILKKLGAADRAEAASIAGRLGLA